MIPKPGDIFDGYRLLAFIGGGSNGKVWQAENVISKELCALKIFPDQGSLAERELQALRLYRSLRHPHLVDIHHAGRIDGAFFYTMDWCESSLAQRKVSPEELLVIAKDLAEALAVLHENGLVHRDIKPENILFRNGQAVLGDIGLITRRENATVAGSLGFLAPALFKGQKSPDACTDCYALAKSIYCALSGQAPEKFPLYDGTLNEAASRLMHCVLATCSDEPEIHNATEFLACLNEPEPPRRKKIDRRRIFLAATVCIAVSAAVFFLFPAIPSKSQNPAPVAPPKPGRPVPDPEQPKKAQPQKAEGKKKIAAPSVKMPRYRREKQPQKVLPRKKVRSPLGEGEHGEIAVRRGWNERNRVELSRGASGLRKCQLEFEIEWNEWRIETLLRNDENFYAEQKLLASLRKMVKELLESGVEAEKPFSYEELEALLQIREPESAELFRRAGAAWNKHKPEVIKNLTLTVKNKKIAPETVLREMAQGDPALRFFGIEQTELLEKYKKVRFSGKDHAEEEAMEAVSRYLQLRKQFWETLRRSR